jgi:hypothetical protein
MKTTAIIEQTPEVLAYTQNANHIDVKVFEGDITLREFIAGMFSYNPSWIKFLYRVRWGFVRLLGMKQDGIPQDTQMKPEEVSFVVGEKATFFTVYDAKENHHWVAGAAESHLTAYLAIIDQPITATTHRFHVVTIVHHHRWTGHVYFNVIRPFHHIVVKKMGQAGIAYRNNLTPSELSQTAPHISR